MKHKYYILYKLALFNILLIYNITAQVVTERVSTVRPDVPVGRTIETIPTITDTTAQTALPPIATGILTSNPVSVARVVPPTAPIVQETVTTVAPPPAPPAPIAIASPPPIETTSNTTPVTIITPMPSATTDSTTRTETVTHTVTQAPSSTPADTTAKTNIIPEHGGQNTVAQITPSINMQDKIILAKADMQPVINLKKSLSKFEEEEEDIFEDDDFQEPQELDFNGEEDHQPELAKIDRNKDFISLPPEL
jgi:hypothetical protein